MSKPSSGHFSNTTGAKNSYNNIMSNRSASDLISERTSNLDLREHPVKHKSSTSIKRIKSKIQTRTASREEFKKYQQSQRLNRRRKAGIRSFWEAERNRIINKQPTTRKWTKEQESDILSNKKPKHNGKTIQAHHSYSVSKYPHLANQSAVIYPATFNEHFNGWHGGNFKNSKPGKPIKIIKDF